MGFPARGRGARRWHPECPCARHGHREAFVPLPSPPPRVRAVPGTAAEPHRQPPQKTAALRDPPGSPIPKGGLGSRPTPPEGGERLRDPRGERGGGRSGTQGTPVGPQGSGPRCHPVSPAPGVSPAVASRVPPPPARPGTGRRSSSTSRTPPDPDPRSPTPPGPRRRLRPRHRPRHPPRARLFPPACLFSFDFFSLPSAVFFFFFVCLVGFCLFFFSSRPFFVFFFCSFLLFLFPPPLICFLSFSFILRFLSPFVSPFYSFRPFFPLISPPSFPPLSFLYVSFCFSFLFCPRFSFLSYPSPPSFLPPSPFIPLFIFYAYFPFFTAFSFITDFSFFTASPPFPPRLYSLFHTLFSFFLHFFLSFLNPLSSFPAPPRLFFFSLFPPLFSSAVSVFSSLFWAPPSLPPSLEGNRTAPDKGRSGGRFLPSLPRSGTPRKKPGPPQKNPQEMGGMKG